MNIRVLIATVAFVPLAAIAGDGVTSLVRGNGADQSASWTLTSQQLAFAETWIQGRKPDCRAGLGSPPTPAVHVHLVRSDGSELELGLYNQPGYAGVVETRVGKSLCHYRGTETEVASLRRAIVRSE